MVIHKTFNDFVLFLYVHMAFADGEFHPLERDVIRGKMSKLFPEVTNTDKKLEEAVTEYHRVEKPKLLSLIRETFHHFRAVKSVYKYRIYSDMYDIINADGKVDESETRALDELKQIINMGSVRTA